MKKRLSVIQINGFSGILMIIGIVVCLLAGFVIFPGIIMKILWNITSVYTGFIPKIATLQGILLWGIIVVTCIIFRRKFFCLEFKSVNDLSKEEMDDVIRRIKIDHQTSILSKAILREKELENEINIIEENVENINNENTEMNDKKGLE